jgi:hypothetical protein
MKKITFHTSFEAQKESELAEILKLSPVERIAHVVEMIRKIYPTNNDIKPSSKRINFIFVGK